MTIRAFDHYTVRCTDLKTSWRFYEEVLRLRVVDRPGTSMPAAKGFIGDVEVLNLFQASAEQLEVFGRQVLPDPDWQTGRMQHVGFWATGVGEMRSRLSGLEVPFRERTLADKHQFVVRDPDGVEIEVNFPLSEVGR